jgi:hypothetical protein
VNDNTLNYEIAIRDVQDYDGRTRYEASLVSEDGQTLYIYEGQLKEVEDELKLGQHYFIQFKPFVNNRWLELKIVGLQAKLEG